MFHYIRKTHNVGLTDFAFMYFLIASFSDTLATSRPAPLSHLLTAPPVSPSFSPFVSVLLSEFLPVCLSMSLFLSVCLSVSLFFFSPNLLTLSAHVCFSYPIPSFSSSLTQIIFLTSTLLCSESPSPSTLNLNPPFSFPPSSLINPFH